MKMILFTVLVGLFTSFTSFAQTVQEPEFIGEVYLLTSDSTYISLSKTPAAVKAKSGLSAMVPLVGTVKSYMIVKGTQAETRIPAANGLVQFIVRAENNDFDPSGMVSVMPFEVKKKERRVLMNQVSVLRGSSSESLDGLPYKFEKYGEHSYKITLENAQTGEYGIMILENEQSTATFPGFRCFGID